jgi:hypothetical protein
MDAEYRVSGLLRLLGEVNLGEHPSSTTGVQNIN